MALDVKRLPLEDRVKTVRERAPMVCSSPRAVRSARRRAVLGSTLIAFGPPSSADVSPVCASAPLRPRPRAHGRLVRPTRRYEGFSGRTHEFGGGVSLSYGGAPLLLVGGVEASCGYLASVGAFPDHSPTVKEVGPKMTSDVDSLERLRDELQDQLAIATAAKTSEESQGALIDYVQNEAEPLSADHPGALIVPFVRWRVRNPLKKAWGDLNT
ncbi:hypothetical protein THAOC_26028 [Thalassiosira oceanica]|uniref:Uncharacterized protein n=1 Tax=Thalassiosira oceanica TaxID=159749 RepID=K0S649_THAOC|nr:hypothetical protein THAOC_26028 [Thalassiosira oceanica]|eukprot:EJK54352.1 hypothetical protein THAOC_26028 [Thalassiosira oceanica]